MSFWSLPGPSSFVGRISRAVGMGRSVVVRLPCHCPKRLATELKRCFHDDMPLIEVSATQDERPVECLYNRLVTDGHPDLVRTASTLVRESSFGGQIIWLEGIDGALWKQWKGFLLEYEHASRSVPSSIQTHLLVPLRGEWSCLPLAETVGIEVLRWNGFVRPLDMLLLANDSLPDLRPGIGSELASSVAAQLAGWDPDLCTLLAALSLDDLVEPLNILREYGRSRGWDALATKDDLQLWASGAMQQFRSLDTLHPAYSAVKNEHLRIRQLLWEAELSVLMPYIERERQLLLTTYSTLLTVPWVDAYGRVIADVFDLEIGHIEYQLSRRPGITREQLRQIADLKEARNSLSHLEPVPKVVLSRIIASDSGRARSRTNSS